jgi:hypothetical protein
LNERRRKAKEPTPRHAATIATWVRLFEELRGGGPYRVSGGDGPAVKQLLAFPEATDTEIEARAHAFFRDPWLREKASLRLFVSRWSQLAAPTRAPDPTASAARPDYTDPSPYQPVSFLRRGT